MRDSTRILVALRKLQQLLNQPGERFPLLEAHEEFINLSQKGSQPGSGCIYVIKCEQRFMAEIMPGVRPLLAELTELLPDKTDV